MSVWMCGMLVGCLSPARKRSFFWGLPHDSILLALAQTIAKFDADRAREALRWVEAVTGTPLEPSSADVVDHLGVKRALKSGVHLCQCVQVHSCTLDRQIFVEWRKFFVRMEWSHFLLGLWAFISEETNWYWGRSLIRLTLRFLFSGWSTLSILGPSRKSITVHLPSKRWEATDSLGHRERTTLFRWPLLGKRRLSCGHRLQTCTNAWSVFFHSNNASFRWRILRCSCAPAGVTEWRRWTPFRLRISSKPKPSTQWV